MTHLETAKPLVSCIMPTYNRREFVPKAIQYFLRQKYANTELIIIDDGSDCVSDLVPASGSLRYFRLNEKITLGAKLNLACEHARGSIIAHWDDDDWYAAWRLSYQVETLMRERTDVCGINNLLYFDIHTGVAYNYIYPADQRFWLLGSSLCYTKKLWAHNRFAEINVGMDGLFVWATPPERVTVLEDSTFSVFMIHGDNVSPKKTEGQWWHPYRLEEIQRLLGSDWDFYQPKEASTPTRLPAESAASHMRRGCVSTTPVRNIYACLVHESEECVIDLVRNLRYHDSSSVILLYNGGKDANLLHNHFPFERYGAVLHPSPRPMEWGSLHDFALDCMRFALESFSFDTLTMVDSDQLGVQSAYSHYLGQFLSEQSDVGMLGNSPRPLPATTEVAPAAQAFKEIDLWRPFLRRFTRGEDKFVHWTFWPGTVFTANAARDLTRIFATDKTLNDIVHRSQIWATEEIILPTLAALLGYKILQNPCSYDYVKYRVSYALAHLESALSREDVYWVHPIPRQYGDPLRGHVRASCNNYVRAFSADNAPSESEMRSNHNLPLTLPILRAMKKVKGWLAEEEADLLITISRKVLDDLPHPHAFVEIGSYCGRSTVVLGSVARELYPQAKVYSIDPHNGKLGALDQGIRPVKPSLETLKGTIAEAGLASVVEIIHSHPAAVIWDGPISLLLIDGLHDYPNVAKDFYHFEPWVEAGGYILFHDYADYYPGVKVLVDEILGLGSYKKVLCVGSMMAVQKLSAKRVSLNLEPPTQSNRPEIRFG